MARGNLRGQPGPGLRRHSLHGMASQGNMEKAGTKLGQGPKISIITVCFNAQLGIDAILKSVEALRYKDFEYLIIDGGSKDGTLEIVRRYGHVVTKVVSEPDRGIYDAMNKGIALASGEFLWFL